MSRGVIPPLNFSDASPSHYSLSLMEQKLEAAEEETRLLMAEISLPNQGGQLSKFQNQGKQLMQNVEDEKEKEGRQHLQEYGDLVGQYAALRFEDILEESGNKRQGPKNKDVKSRSLKHSTKPSQNNGDQSVGLAKGDNCVSQTNQSYDALVSRMCRTESAIQTLKLNLLNLKGSYELKKKQQVESESRLNSLKEKYDEDVSKLGREVSTLRHEWSSETEAKNLLESKLLELKRDSETTLKAKAEVDAEIIGSRDSHEKLNKRIQSLQDDLSREISLRGSLEESHNTLLSRIRETELIVESERTQVKTLTENCNSLTTQIGEVNSNLTREQNFRQTAEKKCAVLEKELCEKLNELGHGEASQESLRSEIHKLRSQYDELIRQLQLMEGLMEKHQAVNNEVQAKNQRLKEALEETELERESIIERQTKELNHERAKHSDFEKLEEKCHHLQSTIKKFEVENDDLVHIRERLETEVREGHIHLTNQEKEHQEVVKKLKLEIQNVQGKMSDLEEAKQKANQDKELLLNEVNSAVDEMSDERWRLKTELQQSQLDNQGLKKSNQLLQDETKTLHERIRALQNQENSHRKLDSTLRETSEEKNRLAYDKGRLQSQVSQLKTEVESLAQAQSDYQQLQRHSEGLEMKLEKSQKELNDYKVKIQYLENQVKQAKESGDRRDADFSLAIKSRDEALKENCQLLEKLNAIEEEENKKVLLLEQSLEEGKQDTRKITQTLEAVMVSHSQLQTAVENLQIDLGHRDSQISQLTSERSEAKKMVRELQREADLLRQRLITLETLESNELEPLRKALKCCRDDNSKMASSLEDVLDSNSELQTAVDKLQADLQKRDHVISKLKENREKEEKRIKNEFQVYEEKLKKSQEQLQQEREKCVKKSNKDIIELRKQNEAMSIKNGELSRANLELRQKQTEHDSTNKELRQKLTNLKTQIDHMTRAKKQMEEQAKHLTDVQTQLDSLEKVRDEYIEKNKHQAKSIGNLLGHLSSLQSELRELANAQFATRELVQRKDEELHREQQLRQDMEKKYRVSRKSKEDIERQKMMFEEKIKLANEESLEVSRNLEAAHDWFKTKFDSLQGELSLSKQAQAELERDNMNQKTKLEEERQRAKVASEKARHMIKSSRKTISQLSDYTDLMAIDPKTHVAALHEKIRKEKIPGKKLKSKSKVSSSKQLEELINRYSTR